MKAFLKYLGAMAVGAALVVLVYNVEVGYDEDGEPYEDDYDTDGGDGPTFH